MKVVSEEKLMKEGAKRAQEEREYDEAIAHYLGEETYTKIFAIGDTHGLWTQFIRIIQDRSDLKGSCIINLGDNGFGFGGFENKTNNERQINSLNDFLKEQDIVCYSIRGNHDDPSYYQGAYNLSNLKLIPDYTQLNLNGMKFLCVGGAISIDRLHYTRRRNVSWFPGEGFDLNLEKAVECDVLITHSAPIWIGPNDKRNIEYWCKHDAPLWDELVVEREEHNQLFDFCKPGLHFCGHFHESTVREKDGCVSTILDELELKEII